MKKTLLVTILAILLIIPFLIPKDKYFKCIRIAAEHKRGPLEWYTYESYWRGYADGAKVTKGERNDC